MDLLNHIDGNSRISTIPSNEAARTALNAPSDDSLRVPCYCEENVWRLACRKLANCRKSTFFAVFISSAQQMVPMFYQRATKSTEEACWWDYHVILLELDEKGMFFVHDVDSRLPCPLALTKYVKHSFPRDSLPQEIAPLFRVTRAETFLQHFHSDRMHMFEDGKWSAPPPPYPCVQVDEGRSGSNLDEYRIMTYPQDTGKKSFDDRAFQEPYGFVLTKEQLLSCALETS